ncbi:hypothetical protein KM043_000454 [Ampulex compressa]|nr:hypothetical protein KM043_000454 [Ampulex compressa]
MRDANVARDASPALAGHGEWEDWRASWAGNRAPSEPPRRPSPMLDRRVSSLSALLASASSSRSRNKETRHGNNERTNQCGHIAVSSTMSPPACLPTA